MACISKLKNNKQVATNIPLMEFEYMMQIHKKFGFILTKLRLPLQQPVALSRKCTSDWMIK